MYLCSEIISRIETSVNQFRAEVERQRDRQIGSVFNFDTLNILVDKFVLCTRCNVDIFETKL